MKQPFPCKTLAAAASLCLLLLSCEKTAGVLPVTDSTVTDRTTAGTTVSEDITAALSPYQVIGNYSLRGSRTKYRGQANEEGDNITVIFDYFGDRTVEKLADKKALSCGYGETNYVRQGWKYIIRYNAAKKQILLSPNETMAAAIRPNSFETLYAAYDPVYQTFTFQTRFTDQEGNENEVVDILSKQ